MCNIEWHCVYLFLEHYVRHISQTFWRQKVSMCYTGWVNAMQNCVMVTWRIEVNIILYYKLLSKHSNPKKNGNRNFLAMHHVKSFCKILTCFSLLKLKKFHCLLNEESTSYFRLSYLNNSFWRHLPAKSLQNPCQMHLQAVFNRFVNYLLFCHSMKLSLLIYKLLLLLLLLLVRWKYVWAHTMAWGLFD